MSFVDSLFGSVPEVLNYRAQRLEMLTSNLANADTPGYKAVDIDFESVFANQMKPAAQRAPSLQTTNANHFPTSASSLGSTVGNQSQDGPARLDTEYRIPHQYRLDGNTVETDVERMEFMENAIRYQAGLNLMSGKIKSIVSTLRGE